MDNDKALVDQVLEAWDDVKPLIGHMDLWVVGIAEKLPLLAEPREYAVNGKTVRVRMESGRVVNCDKFMVQVDLQEEKEWCNLMMEEKVIAYPAVKLFVNSAAQRFKNLRQLCEQGVDARDMTERSYINPAPPDVVERSSAAMRVADEFIQRFVVMDNSEGGAESAPHKTLTDWYRYVKQRADIPPEAGAFATATQHRDNFKEMACLCIAAILHIDNQTKKG